MRNKCLFSILLIPFLFFSALAQKIKPKDYDALSAEAAANSVNDELVEFLSIPNNALIEGHAENNRKWLKSAFKSRGFITQELPTVSRTAFLPNTSQKNLVKRYCSTCILMGNR